METTFVLTSSRSANISAIIINTRPTNPYLTQSVHYFAIFECSLERCGLWLTSIPRNLNFWYVRRVQLSRCSQLLLCVACQTSSIKINLPHMRWQILNFISHSQLNNETCNEVLENSVKILCFTLDSSTGSPQRSTRAERGESKA